MTPSGNAGGKPRFEEASPLPIKYPSIQENVAPGWKGVINFKKGKVHVQALNLSKGTASGESTEWEIPSEIVVDGTIAPEVFWEYFNRIRKAEDRIIGVF